MAWARTCPLDASHGSAAHFSHASGEQYSDPRHPSRCDRTRVGRITGAVARWRTPPPEVPAPRLPSRIPGLVVQRRGLGQARILRGDELSLAHPVLAHRAAAQEARVVQELAPPGPHQMTTALGARLGDPSADLRMKHSGGHGCHVLLAPVIPRGSPLVLARLWHSSARRGADHRRVPVALAWIVTGRTARGGSPQASRLSPR